MPGFAYQAVDATGRKRRGIIEADSPRLARAALREQQLVPLQVTPVSSAQGGPTSVPGSSVKDPGLASGDVQGRMPVRPNPDGLERRDASADAHAPAVGRRWQRASLSAAGRAVWMRQLASLSAAGLTLERSLASLQDEAQTARERTLAVSLRNEVQGGASLGAAMARHGADFSEVVVACVRAGEQSGQLAVVLERLADDMEQSQLLRSKVLAASLYPAVVAGVAVLIVGFLLVYVVPQVAGVFTGQKQALPLLTRIMLWVGEATRAFGPWFFLSALGLGLSAPWLLARKGWRERVDSFLLRLPLLGRLLRNYNAARFAGTLGLLLQAGLPAVRALQTSADVLHNQALRAQAQDAVRRVREGAPIALALGSRPLWPTSMLTFIALGEQTGRLAPLLARSAQQLRDDVQRRALQLASLLEPALVLVMGFFVMLIVLAVLLPIIQVNLVVR